MIRPKPRPANLGKSKLTGISGRPKKRPSELDTGGLDPKEVEERSTRAMKKGGAVKEGSAKDTREDKAMAKKRGMSMAQWEKSAADVKHDAPKKMATGGSVRGTGAAIRGKGFSGTY